MEGDRWLKVQLWGGKVGLEIDLRIDVWIKVCIQERALDKHEGERRGEREHTGVKLSIEETWPGGWDVLDKPLKEGMAGKTDWIPEGSVALKRTCCCLWLDILYRKDEV